MFITKSKQIINLKAENAKLILDNKALSNEINEYIKITENLEQKYKSLCKNYNCLRKRHEKILNEIAIQMGIHRNI